MTEPEPSHQAAALGAVKREAPGLKAAQSGLGSLGEDFADVVEKTNIGRRDGARGAPYGSLINLIDRANVVVTGNGVPGGVFPARTACKAGRRHSRTRVLLPEPLTPVTATKRPRGTRTARFLRLWTLAPEISRNGVDDEAEEGPFDLRKLTGRRSPRVG